MNHRSMLLLILAALLLVGLTACAPEDVQFVQAMLDEWANAKNVNPTNKDGSINFGGLINAGASALDLPGGDDEVKAAIDAKGVVDSIQAADKAAEEAQKALKSGDPNKAVSLLDPAVKDRPNDWWLLNQRGVANIEAGNYNAGRTDLNVGDRAANSSESDLQQRRQLLFDSVARQSASGGLARCETYNWLVVTLNQLVSRGGPLADSYRIQMKEYESSSSQPGVTCRQ